MADMPSTVTGVTEHARALRRIVRLHGEVGAQMRRSLASVASGLPR